MNARVQQSRPAHASTGASPVLKPSRPFAAPDAATGSGHDFARVSVSAGAAPIQRVKVHHDPRKKKYLASGVGAQQVAVSQAALALRQAAPQGQQITAREAARQAKAAMPKKTKRKN